ncbi:MAG TPA: hypothetical protein VNJ03_09585 [Vicinamibacterales bacterium]|nr:hypothetical protein [Vicinamibacterales bacterium]
MSVMDDIYENAENPAREGSRELFEGEMLRAFQDARARGETPDLDKYPWSLLPKSAYLQDAERPGVQAELYPPDALDLKNAADTAWESRERAKADSNRTDNGRLVRAGLSKTVSTRSKRTWDGEPVAVKNPMGKQAAGALGEELIAAYLRSTGVKDTGRMDYMVSVNNYPVNLIAGDTVIEIKTGQASNQPNSQQWRLTIGQPGKAEAAYLATLEPEKKAALNVSKTAAIFARKALAVERIEKDLGRPLKKRTMTLILNPDTKTADIYEFEGFHQRLGWGSSEDSYVATIKYKDASP